jgi:uncharacterized damage-inducible protein DinB
MENWRATPTAMTFAEQAHHLLACDQYLFDRLEGRDVPPVTGAPSASEDTSTSEFQSSVAALERSGERRAEYLQSMSESDLSKTVLDHRSEGDITVWWLIVRGNLDHEIHHRGQIAAFLRSSGLVND